MSSIIAEMETYIEEYECQFNEKPNYISLTLEQYWKFLKATKTPVGEGIDSFNNIPLKVFYDDKELPASEFATIHYKRRAKRRNNGKHK